MRNFYLLLVFTICLALPAAAQPYFVASASISGNAIVYKIKAVNGPITCGWSVLEFFFRNSDAAPNADADFGSAAITVNTTDFPGVSIPYNGSNLQGTETGQNNYWFGTFFFPPTATRTYNQGQEYILCTITLSASPSIYNLELCHNEPFFTPHYVVLADEFGADRSNLTGTCKFYGPGATICSPTNCPFDTPGNNHILPLNGSAPVELLDFQARRHDAHTARLEWHTAEEQDLAGFSIERQMPQGWAPIGFEKARAANGAAYTFFDPKASAPLAYYRLKMVDLDGSFAYSPIRSVAFDGSKGLRVFPNPATQALYLQPGGDLEEEDLDVALYDWSGRLVAQQHLAASGEPARLFSLADFHLPAGIYHLHATTSTGAQFAQNVVLEPQY